MIHDDGDDGDGDGFVVRRRHRRDETRDVIGEITRIPD